MSLLENVSEDNREIATRYMGELEAMGVTFDGYEVSVPGSIGDGYERAAHVLSRLVKLTGLGCELRFHD